MIWIWNGIYFDKERVVKVFNVINLWHIQATLGSQIIQHFLVAVHAFANVWWRVELGEELVITRALQYQQQILNYKKIERIFSIHVTYIQTDPALLQWCGLEWAARLDLDAKSDCHWAGRVLPDDILHSSRSCRHQWIWRKFHQGCKFLRGSLHSVPGSTVPV